MQIHTCSGGQQTGPHSLEEVQARLEARALSPNDLAWYEGAADWMTLAQVPGLTMPETAAQPKLALHISAAVPPVLESDVPFHQPHVEAAPRKALMIGCGVGTILLALMLFGTAVNFLGSQSASGLPLLGILLFPLSLGVGVVSVQFFSALKRNVTGRCQVCGQFGPTVNGTLSRHIGALVLMFHRRITGHMCKDCIGRIFWEYTPVTLVAGWWGLISFFVTPIVLVNNVVFFRAQPD